MGFYDAPIACVINWLSPVATRFHPHVRVHPAALCSGTSCEVYAFLCKYYPTATDDNEEEEEEDEEEEDDEEEEEEDDDDDEANGENKDRATTKQSQPPPKAAATKAAAPAKASSAEKRKATRKKYKHRTKRALFECVLYYWEGRNGTLRPSGPSF